MASALHRTARTSTESRGKVNGTEKSLCTWQADVSAAITQYMALTPVQITFAPAAATSGLAFNVSVQLPPNNQLSTQAGSFMP
jgi:hypothetical protein